jgi:hypothetical protein
MIIIRAKIPGLRWATILLAVYTAVWIPLEGALAQVVLLGVWATAVALGHLAQTYLGGRSLPAAGWLAMMGALGLAAGLGSGLLTLLFMAVKTGLHAHGPEFTPAQINWLVGQVPWWTAAGLFAGLGFALLVYALPNRRGG